MGVFARSLTGAAVAAAWLMAGAVSASDGRFTTSDGVSLHYIEEGSRAAPTVVFVPGWTMPGWIWDGQIAGMKDRYHVLALDPRGQGDSEVAPFGYTHERRGRDIGELIDAATDGRPVVLVGWSLGVLDSLALMAMEGGRRVAGLVLVDNSIGEGPAPLSRGGGRSEPEAVSQDERARRRAAFVAGMFAHEPGEAYRTQLTEAALRMSPDQERQLLAYPVPRTYWREAVHSTDKPVLYVIRPRLRGQGEALAATHPNARVEVFERAGHALFVDEAERFNTLLAEFLDTRAQWGGA